MRIEDVGNVGAIGLIKDVDSYLLPPNAFTIANGVYFDNGAVKQLRNEQRILDVDEPAHFLYPQPDVNLNDPIWTYGTDTKLVSIKITKSGDVYTINSFTNRSGLTTNRYDGWTATTLGRITYFSTLFEPVQKFTSDPMTGGAQELDNWPADWRAGVIRSYSYRLLAYVLNDPFATFEPTKVFYSSAISNPDQEPDTWTGDGAGSIVLPDATAAIIDSAVLGTSNIVYTKNEAYRMDFVGGQNVFNLAKIPDSPGMLSKHCVQTIKGHHIVAGSTDIYQFNGISSQSILTDKVRNDIFNADRFGNASTNLICTAHDKNKREYYFVYDSTIWIWNYERNTWAKDTTRALFIAGGDVWGDTYKKGVPGILCAGALSLYSRSEEIISDEDPYVDGFVERTGLFYGAANRTLASVWPLFTSEDNTMVFEFGAEEYPGAGYVWTNPVTFSTSEEKIDIELSGRVFGYRVTFSPSVKQEFLGIKFGFEEDGSSLV